LKATGFFTERQHPTEGLIRTMASPFEYSATPTAFARHAPHLGEDGPEVLSEAGFTGLEIDALRVSGALIVRGPAAANSEKTTA
jgi:formyl-CoA transferase